MPGNAPRNRLHGLAPVEYAVVRLHSPFWKTAVECIAGVVGSAWWQAFFSGQDPQPSLRQIRFMRATSMSRVRFEALALVEEER